MNFNIYQTIKNRILFLEYAPGQMLNEKILAEEFRVSRTPLREALSRLEWERLVRVVPRAGNMVTSVEFQKMREVFQVRANIEGLIGRLATENISEDQILEMKQLAEECKKLSFNIDPKGLVNIDIRFREILNAASNNTTLKEISDYLYNITLRVWYMIFSNVNWPEEVKTEVNEIEETIEILLKRNALEAERFRQGVIINYVERIKNKF